MIHTCATTQLLRLLHKDWKGTAILSNYQFITRLGYIQVFSGGTATHGMHLFYRYRLSTLMDLCVHAARQYSCKNGDQTTSLDLCFTVHGALMQHILDSWGKEIERERKAMLLPSLIIFISFEKRIQLEENATNRVR